MYFSEPNTFSAEFRERRKEAELHLKTDEQVSETLDDVVRTTAVAMETSSVANEINMSCCLDVQETTSKLVEAEKQNQTGASQKKIFYCVIVFCCLETDFLASRRVQSKVEAQEAPVVAKEALTVQSRSPLVAMQDKT